MRSSETVSYTGLFAFDFDGTIRPANREVDAEARSKLELLGERRVLRTIATGRSLYSLFRVISYDFPVEYVVFSSGAGILRMRDRRITMSRGFDPEQTARITGYLLSSSYDFMVHRPIPENHRFYFHHTGRENEDFRRRCDLYRDYASPYRQEEVEELGASQFLIVDPEGEETERRVKEALGEMASVVRATSPLDHRSTWIEIFPRGTDKGSAAQQLAGEHGIGRERSAAVGNDYNDLHMLEWAACAYVVSDAPEELRRRFTVVSACAEGGAAEAVERWLGESFSGRGPAQQVSRPGGTG